MKAKELETVLADIQALGFLWQMSGHAGGQCYLSTWVDGIDPDLSEAHWNHSSGKDLMALAEAHREQIRELRAEKHRATVAANVYDGDREEPGTEDLEWLIAQGARPPGPEEADGEHEAHVVAAETRWNVWSKNPDTGEWTVTNANLNEDQANKAVSRRNHPSRSSSFPDAVHVALPAGQTPEAAVATLDRLVFLNPDAEEDAGDTIVTGYHTVAEKSCPKCGHPMMRGPLRVKQPHSDDRWVAAWWCADCHFSIEALTDLPLNADPEEAALARADHERETAASESGEA